MPDLQLSTQPNQYLNKQVEAEQLCGRYDGPEGGKTKARSSRWTAFEYKQFTSTSDLNHYRERSCSSCRPRQILSKDHCDSTKTIAANVSAPKVRNDSTPWVTATVGAEREETGDQPALKPDIAGFNASISAALMRKRQPAFREIERGGYEAIILQLPDIYVTNQNIAGGKGL
jgi:hypothetical protein